MESGRLLCAHGHSFPVVRAIPRLLPNGDPAFERLFRHTQASFSSEWSHVRPQDRAWGLDVPARRAMFLRCFDLEERALAGLRILDAGCGHGEVELALAGTGAEVFAMDLSFAVDDDRARLLALSPQAAGAVHFVQSNARSRNGGAWTFDLVHSAGVLHHTPDTRAGFAKVAARVKDRGRCYIEVYSAERKNAAAHAVATALRGVTTRLPPPLLHGLCYAAAPFLWSLTNTWNAVARHEVFRVRTLREMELSLFDGFSPRYAWHHTTPEVLGWFAEEGFHDVRKTFDHKNGFGVVGVR